MMKVKEEFNDKIVKILARIMIICGLFIFFVPLGLFGYYKYNVFILEKKTYDYLYSIGYTDRDIESIEILNMKLSLLSSVVIYKDEPNVEYLYDEKEGRIVQIGINNKDESTDNAEVKYKHLEQK